MAALKTEVLLREFHYNGVRIPDPAPQMTVEQVRDLPLIRRSRQRHSAARKTPEPLCAIRSAALSGRRGEPWPSPK